MNLIIPTSNTFSMPPLVTEVWIAGARRPDAICTEFNMSTGVDNGSATIEFPGMAGNPPYALYDAQLTNENDLVEIIVQPYGVLFRGYITARQSDVEKLKYTALDYGTKFNDVFFFAHEYNFKDDVTGEYKYKYTIRQIANEAYQIYYAWKTGTCDDDFLLSIDLDSFPDVVPNETHVIGQPLLQGLQSILENYDYRYRIKVEHAQDESTIKAFVLGTGAPKSITRGTNPQASYVNQNEGIALVTNIEKTVNATNTLTHVYAEGDNRIIESAFVLTPAWSLVADNFTPPSGHTIKEYVTQSEQTAVINNWARYTTEKIDLKAADKFSQKVINPNYRKKYESVCARFAIPLINNTWYYNDDANTKTLYGESSRQVKIETDLVQDAAAPSGGGLNPFLVYKRLGDNTLYVKPDGFSIKDSKNVVFEKPFVDTVSNVIAKGLNGTCSGCTNNVSTYQVSDAGMNFTSLFSPSGLSPSGSYWMIAAEFNTAYKIQSFAANSLTVTGNLTDAGTDNNKGKHWWITDHDPFVTAGTSGAGMADGQYMIAPSGATTITNQYAGMYLAIGDVATASGVYSINTKPADLKIYRIAYNSDKFVWVDSPGTNLTGTNSKWVILNPQRETKRPFEIIALNAAWKSLQKLAWNSGDLSSMNNKRIVYKNNNEYQWTTEYQNYRLAKKTDTGLEDQYTVTYNPAVLDKKKQFTELAAWAANQIQGAAAYEVEYQVTLRPPDFNVHIGDRLADNQVDTGATITGIKYDFGNYQVQISASSGG